MRITALLFLVITSVTAVGYFYWYKPRFTIDKKRVPGKLINRCVIIDDKEVGVKLKQKSVAARSYIHSKDFNPTYCFLIDMNVNSGKKRFFVYNLKKDSVEMSGLVTHGSGSTVGGTELFFSNVSGSNCTSLGKYKIGKPYNGKFGLAYKLYGLDDTNSKAFERFVVLHAHSCVPESEAYPLSICESWGCPTVSPVFLQSLKKYIDASEKPILLNIYK